MIDALPQGLALSQRTAGQQKQPTDGHAKRRETQGYSPPNPKAKSATGHLL
jgi:hypothetical protein